MMRPGRLLAIIAALGCASVLTACTEHKGPVQRAGEKVDHAADKVSDTVNPKGPVEKAGRAVDRATGN